MVADIREGRKKEVGMNSIENKLRDIGYSGEFEIDCMLKEIEEYGFTWNINRPSVNVKNYYCNVSHEDSGMSYFCNDNTLVGIVEKALLYVLRTEDLRCGSYNF